MAIFSAGDWEFKFSAPLRIVVLPLCDLSRATWDGSWDPVSLGDFHCTVTIWIYVYLSYI